MPIRHLDDLLFSATSGEINPPMLNLSEISSKNGDSVDKKDVLTECINSADVKTLLWDSNWKCVWDMFR